jgi:hypothetical protein
LSAKISYLVDQVLIHFSLLHLRSVLIVNL